MNENLLLVGRVVRAHGIKGEICIQWYADSPFSLGMNLFFGNGQGEAVCQKIVSFRQKDQFAFLALAGVTDRNCAESLRGKQIFAERSVLPQPDEDEVFLQDIVGCNVFLRDGALLGRLDHVEFPAGQEVWSIMTSDGKEVLFPAQPIFIVSINLAQQSVCIDPPEGLLEIYLVESK